MRNNPDDLSSQLLTKIKEWLKEQVEDTKEFVDAKDNNEDWITTDGSDDIYIGWNECSESLLDQIEKWKQEIGL